MTREFRNTTIFLCSFALGLVGQEAVNRLLFANKNTPSDSPKLLAERRSPESYYRSHIVTLAAAIPVTSLMSPIAATAASSPAADIQSPNPDPQQDLLALLMNVTPLTPSVTDPMVVAAETAPPQATVVGPGVSDEPLPSSLAAIDPITRETTPDRSAEPFHDGRAESSWANPATREMSITSTSPVVSHDAPVHHNLVERQGAESRWATSANVTADKHSLPVARLDLANVVPLPPTIAADTDPFADSHPSAREPAPVPPRAIDVYQGVDLPSSYRRPLDAVQQRAADRAAQRTQRIESRKWAGYSPLRPTASAVPYMQNLETSVPRVIAVPVVVYPMQPNATPVSPPMGFRR
jgi:hypothetical protein